MECQDAATPYLQPSGARCNILIKCPKPGWQWFKRTSEACVLILIIFDLGLPTGLGLLLYHMNERISWTPGKQEVLFMVYVMMRFYYTVLVCIVFSRRTCWNRKESVCRVETPGSLDIFLRALSGVVFCAFELPHWALGHRWVWFHLRIQKLSNSKILKVGGKLLNSDRIVGFSGGSRILSNGPC